MTDESNSTVEIGQVVVNAKMTDQVNDDELNLEGISPEEGSEKANSASLKQDMKQLASELQRVKSDIDCRIHGEFDAIKHYVDRAIERDRLAKRP